MDTVRMVAFRTHTRGDVLLQPGVEFEVSETESHAYAARRNPLAGPLDMEEEVATVAKKPAPKARARSRKKAK